jgi:hypothetical protein
MRVSAVGLGGWCNTGPTALVLHHPPQTTSLISVMCTVGTGWQCLHTAAWLRRCLLYEARFAYNEAAGKHTIRCLVLQACVTRAQRSVVNLRTTVCVIAYGRRIVFRRMGTHGWW